MDIDLSEYMGAYVDGCRENLDTMDKMLLVLEQNPANLDAIKDIFRAAHTLKGMSATMGFEKIMHLTHEMEDVLDKMRNGALVVSTEIVDVLFETFDVLRTLVNDSIDATDSLIDLTEITQKLKALDKPAKAEPFTRANRELANWAKQETAPPPPETPKIEEKQSDNTIEQEALMALAEMGLADEDMLALEEVSAAGVNLAIVTVTLIQDCLLKGARVFMMLRTLEEYESTVLHAMPSLKDLEDENFENSFKLLIQTKQNLKNLCAELNKISEVETVVYADLKSLISTTASAPVTSNKPVPPPASPASPTSPTREESKPKVTTPIAPTPANSVTPAPAINLAAINAPKDDSPATIDGEEQTYTKEHPEIVQFVTFTMADEVYALEIQQVEAIINVLAITRVPKAPPYIDGVINLRGEIVPVINTRRRLRLKETPILPTDQIIILSFENEKVKAGFLVDSVQEVTSLAESLIEPPSRVSESVNVEYLRGVGKVNGKIIILLNAHRIVFEKLSTL